MNGAWYAYVGNDTKPWIVALARALLSGVVVGTLAFLAVWPETDNIRVLVSAGLTPGLTVFAIRFGLEGVIDTGKSKRR